MPLLNKFRCMKILLSAKIIASVIPSATSNTQFFDATFTVSATSCSYDSC